MATLPATAAADRTAIARRWSAVRIGLVLLGLGQGFAAAWALVAPRGFYDTFPVAGEHWVSLLPPFNEHLVRDYGASFLALSVLVLAAAWIAERRLVQVALGVWVIAALPHLIFHVAHASDSRAGAIVTLVLNAGTPLVLFFLIPKEPFR